MIRPFYRRNRLFFTLFLGITLLCSPAAHAEHGISLDGDLKYPADFKGFDYTSSKATVGGTLTLHDMGSFDKMNPFTLKGSSPYLLGALVFESLTKQSLDEPFAQYGLIADDILVADDGLSVTFKLRPEATFSDGSPITAEDVAFSLKALRSKEAHPLYQNYWRDVTKIEVVDTHTARFHFSQKNRELPLIVGEMPILSKAFFSKHTFGKTGMSIPLGSGPYVVESVDAGKTITYKRNPDYWGWKIPARRGQFNYERVVIKTFKDPVVALEGFKAGEFDMIYVTNSKQWARDYAGKKFESGQLIKETLPHRNGQGMQGFIFNLRRDKFKDVKVRKALNLAFDFEWSNKKLFYGQYTRSESFFSNSELGATGKPSQAEMALLEPFRERLDPSVFEAVKPLPAAQSPREHRTQLREAMMLLKKAGWRIGKDRKLVNSAGEPFVIDFLLASPAFERVLAPYAANLKRLGITLNYRTVDLSLYQHRVESFDFDMLVHVFGQSQSPGNEQRNMWHSESADVQGSRNMIGLKDPVIDALVNHIIYAKNRQELTTACKALDRVLMSGHYLVPNWHIPYHRISYRNQFERPETVPLYYDPITWLFSWWIKQ
ncbi:MAG: ABC transporter substrate-binding protein [Magnetococcales bacterium]|nr:ABC transporter substrate-binding protein [Magnetococcales bacterium]